MTTWTMFDIHDDALFLIIGCLKPLDFLSLSQTCLHFYHLSDPMKYCAMNKYWKIKCQKSWSLIKKNNYATDNYKNLFQSMIDFMVRTIGENFDQFSIIFHEPHLESHSKRKDFIKSLKLRQQGCNMEITMDKMAEVLKDCFLSHIIKLDNLEMFKIYMCNMNDNFINEKILYRFALTIARPIIFVVIEFGANKIARHLLAPVKNQENIKGKNTQNYDFSSKNINIHTRDALLAEDTPLTFAADCKRVEIVSLLINHPNMTKRGINQGDASGVTPLQCACSLPHCSNTDAPFEDVVEIVKLLINDKRTNINAVDCYGETALMYAIQFQPKIAEIMMENDKYNYNIDVNVQSDSGETVLHNAAQLQTDDENTRSDVIQATKKLLQRKNIDIHIKNNDNHTALDVATKENFTEMIELLNQST